MARSGEGEGKGGGKGKYATQPGPYWLRRAVRGDERNKTHLDIGVSMFTKKEMKWEK